MGLACQADEGVAQYADACIAARKPVEVGWWPLRAPGRWGTTPTLRRLPLGARPLLMAAFASPQVGVVVGRAAGGKVLLLQLAPTPSQVRRGPHTPGCLPPAPPCLCARTRHLPLRTIV